MHVLQGEVHLTHFKDPKKLFVEKDVNPGEQLRAKFSFKHLLIPLGHFVQVVELAIKYPSLQSMHDGAVEQRAQF